MWCEAVLGQEIIFFTFSYQGGVVCWRARSARGEVICYKNDS